MTLDDLRKMTPGVARVEAIRQYIGEGTRKIVEARHLRDGDLATLVAEHGPAETARRTDVSLSTVKIAARNVR